MNSTNVLDSTEIATICRRATAHNYGTVVGDIDVRTDGSVRVAMSSWPRVQEALRALRAKGYDAEEDCRPMDDGLVVTGQVRP